MKFTKMQGIGNDYIYINCFSETVERPSELARRLSDRHFGVGSDGLILICPSLTADFRMEMYNADGSRAQMCGNGIRCLGKYVHDRGLTSKTAVTVETPCGIKTLQLQLTDGAVSQVTVDMGAPVLDVKKVPMRCSAAQCIQMPILIEGREVPVTAVSMGNPHAVVFVPDIGTLDLPRIGPIFEHHSCFPERVNTEFVQVLDAKTLKMRVWERGSGETLACGTGACASVVAGVLGGICARTAAVKLLGGSLTIQWDETTDHVFLTGPAAFVFDGEIKSERGM